MKYTLTDLLYGTHAAEKLWQRLIDESTSYDKLDYEISLWNFRQQSTNTRIFASMIILSSAIHVVLHQIINLGWHWWCILMLFAYRDYIRREKNRQVETLTLHADAAIRRQLKLAEIKDGELTGKLQKIAEDISGIRHELENKVEKELGNLRLGILKTERKADKAISQVDAICHFIDNDISEIRQAVDTKNGE